MTMNEYLWKSSDAAAEIRLLVEGAIALYEGDAMGLQTLQTEVTDDTPEPKRESE